MASPSQEKEQAPDKVPKVPKAPKAAKAKATKTSPVATGPLTVEPAYFAHRIDIFNRLKAKQDEELAKKPRVPITVTLPDGKAVEGTAWETTPLSIAQGISKSLADRTVISRVNGDLWDLVRPLEADARLELLDFTHDDAKKVYWHSSAHILGEAAEKRFGCHLCIGPPIDDGFYYEFGMPDPEHATVHQEDKALLETIMDSVVKEKQPFERLVLSKEDLLHMFQSNPFKQQIIQSKIPDGTASTVYRCGPLIDLCRGPHVVDTGRIKAFKVLKLSASYFLGDANNASLQRVYGISFPDKKLLKEHLEFLEEAAKRDHRKIGVDQELFLFNQLSPGSPFFLPHGMRILNALKTFITQEYPSRGYDEISTPNMFNAELWKTSGHWQHYKDDMFCLDVDKTQFALKPMNCPGHCVVFASRERSYRELPIRFAEFGVLHRNEASGALSGLTRVRRFVQDDAHIFCAEDQIAAEIKDLFQFIEQVYGTLGMKFKLNLSTRPENFLGDIETWDRAEESLTEVLDEFKEKTGSEWVLNPGDGAFYGPKIDIHICDALRRWHQCATLQLDFQLPRRFNLTYMTGSAPGVAGDKPDVKPEAAPPKEKAAEAAAAPAAGAPPAGESKTKQEEQAAAAAVEAPIPAGHARPVMIHRAVVGSFERFLAVLTEHFAGKWPMWLSPRQILVVPVMTAAEPYVKEVTSILKARGFYADSDLSSNTMNKKIRNGQVTQYNFILVLGAKEVEDRSVSIRGRESEGKLITMPLDEALDKLARLRDERGLGNKLE